MTICFFCQTGRTFTFRNAKVKVDNETVIVVDYTAMSDGKRKTVVMQKTAIVGWAVSDDA